MLVLDEWCCLSSFVESIKVHIRLNMYCSILIYKYMIIDLLFFGLLVGYHHMSNCLNKGTLLRNQSILRDRVKQRYDGSDNVLKVKNESL